MPPARSFLYVPGDQPDMLAKADRRGADALIVDLEDAIPPDSKATARTAVARWISARTQDRTELWVRVNPFEPLLRADLEAVTNSALAGIYLPKVGSVDDLETVADLLDEFEANVDLPIGRIRLAPLLESARGILAAPSIAARRRVSHLAIGEQDLSAELGMDPSEDHRELLAIRSGVILASAAAGIRPPVGPVDTNLHNLEALRESSQALKRLGYGGRAAIHPSQVPLINEVFTPSPAEVAAAQEIIRQHEAAERNGSGVTVAVNGTMIDPAVVRRARRVISRADRT